MRQGFFGRLGLVLAVPMAFGAGGAPAASAADKPEFVRTLRSVLVDYRRSNRGEGLDWGDWNLRAQTRLAGEYADNIFAVPVAEVDDFIVLVRPSFELSHEGEGHDVSLDGFLQQQWFVDGTNPDVTEGGANFSAAIDFAGNHRLTFQTGYLRNVQERTDPEDTGGQQPEEDRTYARIIHYVEWARYSLRTLVEGRRFDFLDNVDDDRDRGEVYGSWRFRFALSDEVTPYFGVDVASIDFNDPLDDFGFNRDTTRAGARLGITVRQGDVFYLQLAVGATAHEFDDPLFDEFTSLIAEMDVVWNLSERTALVFDLSRNENVTPLSGASARIKTSADLRLEHFITPKLAGTIAVGVRKDEFEEFVRNDDWAVASIGLEWFVTRNIHLTADYRFTDRDSTDAGEAFSLNAFRVGARIEL